MTTAPKYTPGPWHLGIKQAEQIVYNSRGWAIANATVYHAKTDLAETKANARLIAAAPDMYASLRDSEAMLEALYADRREHAQGWSEKAVAGLGQLVDRVRAAIAKAEGRTTT